MSRWGGGGASMADRRTGRRIRSDFNVGGEQAEADPLLSVAFYESGDYRTAESRDDPRCFLIARTGGGKSAVLQRLEEVHPEHVVRITPEDLALPYITDLRVIRYLDDLDVNLDLFFIALWKHVLLVEIIRHRYHVNTPQAKENFLRNIRQKISRDPAKRAALEYLDEFEGRFWCEADQRVKDITDKFERQISAGGKAGAAVPGVEAGAFTRSTATLSNEERSEQVERFQRIVNETQLARLNKMLAVLNDEILDRPQYYTYVIIDDLDRDWVDERLANDLIRCLFRTVLDLQRVENLKVLVALRTNIFQQIEFTKRSAGQEEKFRALVHRMHWSRSDLTHMLNERVRVSGERHDINVSGIKDILPPRNRTRGDALEYILERTLLRPRDLLSFVNECLRQSSGKSRMTWETISAAEHTYSENRLLALRDEWKVTYPDVQKVFDVFRKAHDGMPRQEFQQLLDDIALLAADPSFEGTRWLTDLSEPLWSGSNEDWVETYQRLAEFVYSMGFVGVAPDQSRAPTFAEEDPSFVSRRSNLGTAARFFVHRTFHEALGVQIEQRG